MAQAGKGRAYRLDSVSRAACVSEAIDEMNAVQQNEHYPAAAAVRYFGLSVNE